MRKKTTVAVTILFCILVFVSTYWFAAGHRVTSSDPKAVQGVLDLTQWDFAKNGIVPMDGQWEFYPDQLLTPDDFDLDKHGGNTPEMTGYVHVPDRWERYAVGGQPASPYGYATFRLRVKHRGPLVGADNPAWSDVGSNYWAYEDIEEASTDHDYIMQDNKESLVDIKK